MWSNNKKLKWNKKKKKIGCCIGTCCALVCPCWSCQNPQLAQIEQKTLPTHHKIQIFGFPYDDKKTFLSLIYTSVSPLKRDLQWITLQWGFYRWWGGVINIPQSELIQHRDYTSSLCIIKLQCYNKHTKHQQLQSVLKWVQHQINACQNIEKGKNPRAVSRKIHFSIIGHQIPCSIVHTMCDYPTTISSLPHNLTCTCPFKAHLWLWCIIVALDQFRLWCFSMSEWMVHS